jgi:hypothetical protein
MPSDARRAAARRRAWGRGPVILRFEPLEGRALQAVIGPMADVVATQFNTVHTADWGDLIHATGTISNQGTATTTAAVPVAIYASSTPVLGAGSVTDLLGYATVPPGLAPGASYNFDQIVGLPPSLTTSASSMQTIYVTLQVDPTQAVPEASTADKSDRGIGVDTSVLTISPHQPAILAGTAFGLTQLTASTPGALSWGDTLNVVEQITNKGQGDAPPTRARIVLTPAGATPGAYTDVTIGNIAVPSIPAFQTTNVSQSITLPSVEPSTLGGATQFTISVVQDGDFLTQPIYPRIADQGNGLDQATINIGPGPAGIPAPGPQPDLAPASVLTSTNSLYWGQQFQVSTVIQNVGLADAGPFRVRFVAGAIGSDLSQGIFLGDTTVNGLVANGSTTVIATVQLPSKLPYGAQVASPAYFRIYAIADPEDVINESLRSNNMASSAPVLLQVINTDGSSTTVPTYPANVYNNPVTAAKAAKAVAKKATSSPTKTTTKLGKPSPASTTKTKLKVVKHKPDFLASLSEGVVKGVEKQIKAIPHGFQNFLNDIGASGNSSGSSSTATNTAATATTTTVAAPSTFSGAPSGGSGGFNASGTGSSLSGY